MILFVSGGVGVGLDSRLRGNDGGVIEMPIDPVTGKALAYKKTDEGFVLTSEAKDSKGSKRKWEWNQ